MRCNRMAEIGPLQAKHGLAYEVTRLYYGERAALAAAVEFIRVVHRGRNPFASIWGTLSDAPEPLKDSDTQHSAPNGQETLSAGGEGAKTSDVEDEGWMPCWNLSRASY